MQNSTSHRSKTPRPPSVSQIVMYIIMIKLASDISEVVVTWSSRYREKSEESWGQNEADGKGQFRA